MLVKNIFAWSVFIIGGFLSGSIMYSSIVPQLVLNKDICKISTDHNPGAYNVFSECGILCGVLCLSLDIMKGFIPIMLACRHLNMNNMLFGIVMTAPVLGHALAPLHHFHGGKCISTAFGEMLALFSFNRIGIILVIAYIAVCVFLKGCSNRTRSIIAFSVFGICSGVLLCINGKFSIAVGCLLISFVAVLKHTKYFSYE